MEDRNCYLITGATSGIGRGIVELLLENTSNLVFGLGRQESKVKDLMSKDNFKFISYDLSDVKGVSGLFNNEFKGIKFSGFVHCAGVEETLPLSLYNPQKMLDIFQVNFFSAVELLRFLSKKKHSNDHASFVLVSSVMGELGQAGKVGYCSSKAALLGAVRALALELTKRKIRVNAVSPGIVNTPLTEKLFEQIDEANVERIKNMHPIGIGEVEDVVEMIVFLLSNQSKWITGQNIKIDGGYSIQ